MENTLYVKKNPLNELPVIKEKVFCKSVSGVLFVGYLSTNIGVFQISDHRIPIKGPINISEVEYWLKPV